MDAGSLSNEKALDAVSQLRKRGWLSGENRLLQDTDLIDANLSKVILMYANLSKAKLLGANLSQANLSSANLKESDLIDAKLANADLSYSNLSQADLCTADFRGADLLHADLTNAIIGSYELRNWVKDIESIEIGEVSIQDEEGKLTKVSLEYTSDNIIVVYGLNEKFYFANHIGTILVKQQPYQTVQNLTQAVTKTNNFANSSVASSINNSHKMCDIFNTT